MLQESLLSSVYESLSYEPETGKRRAALPKRFVKLPTKLLGKVLDYKHAAGGVVIHGHASANAIHTLAIRQATGHVLNEKRLKSEFGIGWRRFNEGLTVLKACGVMEREQRGHRTFAVERIIGAVDGMPFVPLDKALLTERSNLVAFVATVNLSPDPQRPADVAARFGITSPATIRELVHDAKAGGHIAHYADAISGKILVARRGHVFGDTVSDGGDVKNGAAKNGATKNGVHIEMGDSIEMGESRKKKKESYRTSSLRDDGPRALQRERTDDFFKKKQIQPLAPERVTLGNWRKSFPGVPSFRGKVDEVMSIGDWRHQLGLYGGAPVQVTTPEAHRQALEIAHELSSRAEKSDAPVCAYSAMLALACTICTEHGRGKPIYSLGFIAANLALRATRDKDPAWAFNLPRRQISVTDGQYDGAAETAARWVRSLATFDNGARINAESLRSTPRVEELAEHAREHGWPALVEAINHVTGGDIWAGRTVHGWGYFFDYIGAAKAAKAAAAAPPPQPAPLQPLRQGAGWEADVESACNWLRNHLGSDWHNSNRVGWAAVRAGIDRQVLQEAKARLGLQKEQDARRQQITALPGVPPPSADNSHQEDRAAC